MLDLPSTATLLTAAQPVALVLAEAVALYVGYGALTRVTAPHVERALRGE